MNNPLPTPSRLSFVYISSAFGLFLSATLVAFWPALTGPFFLDDIPNLIPLGDRGGLTNIDNLIEFVFNGRTSSLGRPLTLLTFAINDQYWPAVPWPFKYTNLLIHLLNGVLIFVLTTQITRIWREPLTYPIAITCMALWLLHPMHLSAIMMVVQRMTELSATFTLLALILFIKGRQTVIDNPLKGYIWMSFAITFGGVLATLSKENGALLPLYALLLETTLIQPKLGAPSHWKSWSRVFLLLPLALLAGYLIIKWPSLVNSGYESRDFTLGQRLLTESRILFDYLGQLFVPRIAGAGLFHDDYPVSAGLFSPISTFIAVIAWGIFIFIAIILRSRHRHFSFAIAWFLGGHILESTFMPLELYFEHRNYLPMLGPLYATSYYTWSANGAFKRAAIAGLSCFIAIEITMTIQSGKVWGNEEQSAVIWAMEKPASVRSQQLAANYFSRNRDFGTALKYLENAKLYNPRNPGIRLEIIQMQCLLGLETRQEVKELLQILPSSQYEVAGIETVSKLTDLVEAKACDLSYADLHEILDRYLSHPIYGQRGHPKAKIYYAKGFIYFKQRLLNSAIEAMSHASQAEPNVDILLTQAIWLLSAGLPAEANQFLDHATDAQTPLMPRTREIEALRKLAETRLSKTQTTSNQ